MNCPDFVLPLSTYGSEYNELRRGYLLLIAYLIKPHLIDQDINDHLDMIMDVEQSCYQDACDIAEYELLLPDFTNVQFDQLYRTRVTRITKNMDIHSEVGDDYLVSALIDGRIDAKRISKLPPEELSPMRNADLIGQLAARRAQKRTLKVSTMYRCPKRGCGKSEATVRSAQLRSGDEGETIICVCTFCGHKWTI